jgi:hypothetical protein
MLIHRGASQQGRSVTGAKEEIIAGTKVTRQHGSRLHRQFLFGGWPVLLLTIRQNH